MKVIRHYGNKLDRSATDPLLEDDGFWWELRSGDVLDPLNGKWFEEPFPTRIWKFFCNLPVLPFISWRIGSKAGYIGFKIYGADSPAYLNWMNPDDVYEGSQAMCLSARPFTTMED